MNSSASVMFENTFHAANTQIVHSIEERSFELYAFGVAGIASFLFLLKSFLYKDERLPFPIVGYRWFWEPTWLLRLRFLTNSFSMLKDGYTKHKDGIFVVRRCDTDIVIVSPKYIDEIRRLPETTISVSAAFAKNFVGQYNGVTEALADDYHNRALLRELTANIGLFLEPIRDEVEFSIRTDMPRADDWVEIDINEVLLRMSARVSSRIFVGLPLCRNSDWIQLSKDITVNVFATTMCLRMLPSFLHFLHPVIIRFVPQWYRLARNYRLAKELVTPVIAKHVEQREKPTTIRENPDATLLTWMSDFAADEHQADPSYLAHKQIMLGLGSIYTIRGALANVFYDLCEHPELIPALREEIEQVMLEGGGWDKPTITKMWKLDSFIVEVQRVNPPSLMAFNHRTLKPITLSDGSYIPASSQIAVPSAAILCDPEIVSEPEKFDPLRSYRARLQPGESHRHQFGQMSKMHMHFGFGRHACPGRTLAANEIKLITAALLLHFDFRQIEGKSRPRNIMLDEFVFTEPGTNLMVRRRTVRDGVCGLAV